MIPADVLMVRAIGSAERAELQIKAQQYEAASLSIEECIALIRQALASA